MNCSTILMCDRSVDRQTIPRGLLLLGPAGLNMIGASKPIGGRSAELLECDDMGNAELPSCLIKLACWRARRSINSSVHAAAGAAQVSRIRLRARVRAKRQIPGGRPRPHPPTPSLSARPSETAGHHAPLACTELVPFGPALPAKASVSASTSASLRRTRLRAGAPPSPELPPAFAAAASAAILPALRLCQPWCV